ncbi:adenylate/guanylate cyclase domain-containing protein [Aestuariispira insulae]|uniref:Adenylate cyclase n=1 Tax=Aestuariispira insulae TaxID=1461337 RepID=A0A3D9HUQ6_9PROT|nr:adenylate/guanylate cyclase domain-containing protein [Aestuariispira insulae]RED53244.1 adenylate cyclase [Aestuariispira insulae]
MNKQADCRGDFVQDISDQVIAWALEGTSVERLLKGFCAKMRKAGFPLWRAHMACSWLHPMFQAISFTWHSDTGRVELVRHLHSEKDDEEWLRSPLKAMIDNGENELRAHLETGEGCNQYPVFQSFRERGATDYFGMMVSFGKMDEAKDNLDGFISSWATDREGGFTEDEINALRRLFPRLALGVKSIIREQTARNVLSAYLGPYAGQKVLEGQIKRGDGERIRAIIWYNDLRSSTRLADQMPPEEFLALLNRYFEMTAGIVMDHGGEVLRFVGDAVLAIFAIEGPGGAERAARMALAAAKSSLKLLEEDEAQEDGIQFGIGLHVGEVMYGNIGVPERLEFSVIGPAANEAARMEAATKTFGERMLVSEAFSELTPREHWRALGAHRFDGVSREINLFTLN